MPCFLRMTVLIAPVLPVLSACTSLLHQCVPDTYHSIIFTSDLCVLLKCQNSEYIITWKRFKTHTSIAVLKHTLRNHKTMPEYISQGLWFVHLLSLPCWTRASDLSLTFATTWTVSHGNYMNRFSWIFNKVSFSLMHGTSLIGENGSMLTHTY